MVATAETESRSQLPPRLLTGEIRLVPVVELAPYDYGSAPQPSASPWGPEQGEAYWRACLREAGITELNPIAPGSWLVPIESIKSPEMLGKILKVHFADGIPDDLDEIGPFLGGLALAEGNDVLVLPTCCGDLQDLDNWRTASSYESDAPQMLWIGHPWLSAWREASLLHIREETEYGPPPTPGEFVLDPAALDRATHAADHLIDMFLERVVVSLRGLTGSLDVRSVGSLLVGRSGSADL
jgi:hypothetical protein